MKNKLTCFFISFILLFVAPPLAAQTQPLDSLLPVRGFCIAAPRPAELGSFVLFVEKELGPRQVNTLILRVDFNYQYTSRPELRDSNALSKADVKKIVSAARKFNMRIIPQVNLLGHQSWASDLGNLLEKYPELDETPHVRMPAEYKWPNADSLYCKSYCPLHPKVHGIVFPMIDEITEAFETNAFHAGMDEVFYIGDPKCPRCKGKNKAALFAGEVTAIRNHLAKTGKELWIWGDRLIDGYTTDIGMWEGSHNNTHPAIDMIPKDVVICDWHYERADKTAIYFALKGFRVVTCPWRNAPLAKIQLQDIIQGRETSTKVVKDRLVGMVQTVWSPYGSFQRGFYSNAKDNNQGDKTPWHCFRELYDAINKL